MNGREAIQDVRCKANIARKIDRIICKNNCKYFDNITGKCPFGYGSMKWGDENGNVDKTGWCVKARVYRISKHGSKHDKRHRDRTKTNKRKAGEPREKDKGYWAISIWE